MKSLLIFILVFLAPAASWAQLAADTTYQVEATATASPMFNFFRSARIPGSTGKTSVGYSVTVRFLWHPSRLLSVGLLSGYSFLAEDEINAGAASAELKYRARLEAVPLLLALTMQKFNFEFGLGVGPYLLITSLRGGNSAPARGNRLELGMTYFASYTFSVGDRVAIGPELRAISFRYRGIICLMPSCSFRFVPLRY